MTSDNHRPLDDVLDPVSSPWTLRFDHLDFLIDGQSYLTNANTVYVVSPCGPVTEQQIAPGLQLLREWGAEPILDDGVFGNLTRPTTEDLQLIDKYGDFDLFGFLAASSLGRRSAIERAIASQANVVWCTRGGVGFTELLPYLDLDAVAQSGKAFIGFSDVTALLLAAFHSGSSRMVHGPALKTLNASSPDANRMKHLLFDGQLNPTPISLQPAFLPDHNLDSIAGPFLGGNATLIATMLDQDYTPNFDGALLFLEDTGEADFRLFRLLNQIVTSRRMRNIRAVVLGTFDNCHGCYVPPDRGDDYIRALAKMVGYSIQKPVFLGFPAGHTSRNYPFVEGTFATIQTEKNSL